MAPHLLHNELQVPLRTFLSPFDVAQLRGTEHNWHPLPRIHSADLLKIRPDMLYVTKVLALYVVETITPFDRVEAYCLHSTAVTLYI